MQPTPRRHDETEEQYTARVRALAAWIFNPEGAAAYIAQEKRAGRVRKLTRRELNQLFGKE